MQERTWLKALPKMEKELELIKVCVDVLQTCAMMPRDRDDAGTNIYDTIALHSSNILYRYMNQLDILTKPSEKGPKLEFEIETT